MDVAADPRALGVAENQQHDHHLEGVVVERPQELRGGKRREAEVAPQ